MFFQKWFCSPNLQVRSRMDETFGISSTTRDARVRRYRECVSAGHAVLPIEGSIALNLKELRAGGLVQRSGDK